MEGTNSVPNLVNSTASFFRWVVCLVPIVSFPFVWQLVASIVSVPLVETLIFVDSGVAYGLFGSISPWKF
jgi:hypothetical protein